MLCLGGCRGVAIGRLMVATAVLTIHFILAFLVIGVILLQGPKGEGLGAIGGSARMFHGPRPRGTPFTRGTAGGSGAVVLSSPHLTFFRYAPSPPAGLPSCPGPQPKALACPAAR